MYSVAYAFVPYGEYMRERRDLVVGGMMAVIGVGVMVTKGNVRPAVVRMRDWEENGEERGEEMGLNDICIMYVECMMKVC